MESRWGLPMTPETEHLYVNAEAHCCIPLCGLNCVVRLQAVLDESETITHELLNIILDNLCGAPRKKKSHGYHLAKSIIAHTHDKLQGTLCHVMERTLKEQFMAVRKYEDPALSAEFGKHRQSHLQVQTCHSTEAKQEAVGLVWGK